MAKVKADPIRSAAAKRGWETRRKRAAAELRYKRSLAARKGWATRRIKQAQSLPVSKQVSELQAQLSELKSIVAKQQEIIDVQEARLTKRQKKIEVLEHAIKRIKKPYAVELQEAITRDRESADLAIYHQVENLRGDGRGVYQALYEVWEEVNFSEDYEDLSDVREAWFEEYLDTG